MNIVDGNVLSQGENNKNIGSIIWKMIPSCLSLALVFTVVFSVDSFLAGFFLGKEGLTAIAIGFPAYAIFLTVLNALAHGTELRLTWALGRGDENDFKRAFSSGLYFTVLVALVFAVIIYFFPEKLVMAFGGMNCDSAIVELANKYVKVCSLFILFIAGSSIIEKVLGVVGYQAAKMTVNLVNVIANIILSTIFVSILPAESKVIGMGIGTTCASLISIIVSIMLVKIKKIDVSYKPVIPHFYEVKETVKSGFPSSFNYMIDIVVKSVVNNIILKFYGSDGAMLAIFACVSNVKQIAKSAVDAIGYAVSPLMGIMYAARDKIALKKTLKKGTEIGFIVTVGWCFIIYLMLPVVFRAQGMEFDEIGNRGAIIVLIFMVAMLLTYVLTIFYESTQRFGLSMLVAIIPDSIIFPAALILFGKTYGPDVLWLSYAANGVVFLIVGYIVFMIKSKKIIVPLEQIMCLNSSIKNSNAVFDLTIENNIDDVTTISKRLYDFYEGKDISKKTQYFSALSLEEIVSDIVNSTNRKLVKNVKQYIDIKVFEDDSIIEIVVRDIAKPYNPLEYDDIKDVSKVGIKIVQKCAREITYAYAYKMNIVNIVLDKGKA